MTSNGFLVPNDVAKSLIEWMEKRWQEDREWRKAYDAYVKVCLNSDEQPVSIVEFVRKMSDAKS